MSRRVTSVDCPHCGALSGYECLMPSGSVYPSGHMKRWDAVGRQQRADEEAVAASSDEGAQIVEDAKRRVVERGQEVRKGDALTQATVARLDALLKGVPRSGGIIGRAITSVQMDEATTEGDITLAPAQRGEPAASPPTEERFRNGVRRVWINPNGMVKVEDIHDDGFVWLSKVLAQGEMMPDVHPELYRVPQPPLPQDVELYAAEMEAERMWPRPRRRREPA